MLINGGIFQLGFAIPDSILQSRDSGLTGCSIPGSRDPGIEYFTVYNMLKQDKGNFFVDHNSIE